MKKILFVTTRNILTPCGELRLIKNRAESLYMEFGVVTDILALQRKSRISKDNLEQIKAGGRMQVIGHSKFDLLAKLSVLKKQMDQILQGNKYSCIVLSGGGLEKFAPYIKATYGLKVLMDIHGASEDALEIAKRSGISKKFYFTAIYLVGERNLSRYAKYADGFFVVTEALREYVKKKYTTKYNAVFYEVPCAASGMSIQDKEYTVYREKYRGKYNIDAETVTFIYSGGTSPWQCIDETVDLYQKIVVGLNRRSVLLMLSYNADQIKAKVGDIPSVIVDSYDSAELWKVLCAGDFAFLLRKDTVTNNVAFPNKYLEYVQSRMRIISTPYVYEVAQQITENKIGVLYDMSDNIEAVMEYICKNLGSGIEKKTADRILVKNSFTYRLRSLAEEIRNK